MNRLVCVVLVIGMLLSLSSCGSTFSGDEVYNVFLGKIGESGGKSVSGNHLDFAISDESTVSYERTYRSSSNPTRRLRLTGSFFNFMLNKIKYDAERFVKDHPDVEVIVTMYPSASDYRAAFPVLLMANSHGDLVLLPSGINHKILGAGHFLDLMPYVRKEASLNEENYYMNVLTANREGDCLYDLCLYANTMDNLRLRTNVAPEYAEIFTSKKDLNYNDLVEMYLEAGRKARAEGREWETKFSPSFNPMEFLVRNVDSLIDFENKKAKFTDPEFMNLMERVKNEVYYGDELLFTEDGMEWNLGTGFGRLDLSEVVRPETEYFFRGIYGTGFGENPPFKGNYYTKPRLIPTAAGNYVFGSEYRFAVSKSSGEPNLAWNFLMYILEEQPLPPEKVNEDEWRNVVDRTEDYINRVGGTTHVNRRNFDRLMELEAEKFRIFYRNYYSEYPTEGTFEEYYKDLAERSREVMNSFNKSELFLNDLFQYYSRGILWDDMYLYLTDKQTVEQTMQNIENKVNIWLNE